MISSMTFPFSETSSHREADATYLVYLLFREVDLHNENLNTIAREKSFCLLETGTLSNRWKYQCKVPTCEWGKSRARAENAKDRGR